MCHWLNKRPSWREGRPGPQQISKACNSSARWPRTFLCTRQLMYRAWFIHPIGTLEALSRLLVFCAASMLTENWSERYRCDRHMYYCSQPLLVCLYIGSRHCLRRPVQQCWLCPAVTFIKNSLDCQRRSLLGLHRSCSLSAFSLARYQ